MYDTGGLEPLPIATMRETDMCVPALVFVPGEIYSFYMPTSATIGDFDFEAPGASYPVTAGLTNVVTTIGTHQIISCTFPSGIPDGDYEINMGGYKSNPVCVINSPSEANQISAFVRFSHKNIIDKFYYPYVDPSYKQRMRIRLSAPERKPEIIRTGYRSTATGKFKNLRGNMSEYVVFQTLDYSTDDHLACRMMTEHDTVLINDLAFTIREGSHYDYTPNADIPISTGSFSMVDDASSVLFRC